MRYPPGPPGRPLIGNLPDFARDVLGFHERCREEFGDIARVRVGARTIYLVQHPELIDEVLVTNHRNFIKHSFFWRHVTAIFGRGLLTNEGESWLQQRRLMAPAFHRDRIVSYGNVMVEYTQRALADWKPGELRNVHHDLMHLTLEIVAKVLFDADVGGDAEVIGRAFDAVTDEIAARFRRPVFIPDWVPLPGNFRYRAGVRALDALVYRIIAEHRASGAQGNDLLSMLMSVRDEEGSCMSDQQLRDEAITILLAGHETTALALSWTLYLLALHPDVDARLQDELQQVLNGRTPTPADLPALRYTDHVIKEAMRIYPPAYGIGREAVAACELGGYHVPAGTTIFMSAWVTHRDPRWFADPHTFNPDRWNDGLAERLPRHAYMPFGGGPRICIGNSFAIMEATLLLASIAQRYRFVREDPIPVVPFPTITLRPSGGVQLRVHARA
ncbi:MAG TPA: cytochrome P450 [Burkholderiales bacterium]|nr:cytochrome P450 [Burkholderiales bacterium]